MKFNLIKKNRKQIINAIERAKTTENDDKYLAIYKCRLCGQESYGQALSFEDERELIRLTYTMRVNGKDNCLGKQTIHKCSDDSISIADFAGFKKIND